MSDKFLEEVGNYFTKEEWERWVRGEVKLFDLFVERTGMTKEDADRIRRGKPQPNQTTQYKKFLKKT